MHHWKEKEIIELLAIRASESIRNEITGTVKDSVVYQRISKLLAERGVYRSHMQVISKLKALKKQYAKCNQQKSRCETVDWPLYEQCHRAFSSSATPPYPLKRSRSPTPPPAPQPPQSPPEISSKQEEVEVSLWDDVDDGEIHKHLGPVEADDDDEDYMPPEQLPHINATFKVPSKKRKTTVMDQVSMLVSTTVAQLKEMDATMQAQEDARLQRLMDHERDLQNSLMSQLFAMHERISRENHERHVELVDRILSRFPSSSTSSGP
ncbi:uncharacterized protein V6R79_007678 [Siganus canaliculatus]